MLTSPRRAFRRTISFESETGKRYSLNNQTAVLLVRPRGFHLPERHWMVDARPAFTREEGHKRQQWQRDQT